VVITAAALALALAGALAGARGSVGPLTGATGPRGARAARKCLIRQGSHVRIMQIMLTRSPSGAVRSGAMDPSSRDEVDATLPSPQKKNLLLRCDSA
jgi:hypothetical protein